MRPENGLPEPNNGNPKIKGYRAASQFSGFTTYLLETLVARKLIRCYKPSSNTIYFDPIELTQDIEAFKIGKQKLR